MVSQLGGIRHRNDDVLADLGLFHRGAAAVLEQAEAGVAHSSADDVCDWDVGIVVAGSAAGRGGGPVLVSDEEPASGPHPDRDRSGCRCRRRTSSEPTEGASDEHGTDPTSVIRLTYWKDGIKIANENPVLRIGYANWADYYRRYYNPRGQLPHNIFVQAGAELGYTGLLVFGLLIAYTFVVNSRTRKIARQLPEGGFLFGMANGLDGALVGYLVSGFFVTVLYYPFFWINLAMTVALHKAARHEFRQVPAT